MSTDDFIEAGSSTGETWKPENAGDTIQGTLKTTKTNVGVNNSNIYIIQVDGEDEPTSVWGSAVLDSKFQEIPEGSLVKIEFLGRVKGKSPQPYKDYKVLYKKPETWAADAAAKVDAAEPA